MLKKKFWVHYEQLRMIIGIYITLFFTIPIIALGFGYLAYSSEIEDGVQGALRLAIFGGLKWYGIIILIITVLFFIWFLCRSSRVKFTETCIQVDSGIFSKKFRKIHYEEITRVVFCDGLWRVKGEYYYGRKIIFYNKGNIIFEAEISPKLCLLVVLNIADNKIWLVNDERKLSRVENYFMIDFMSLSLDNKLEILKYYCKRKKYKTGEEILTKK